MASKLAHTSFLSSSISGTRCRPLKKQISLFLFFSSFWVCTTVFLFKKAKRIYYDENSRNLLSRIMEFYTSWCCNLFSLSKTVHRPVYLSIWCKNHSTACLTAMHWAAQCAKQPKPLVQLVHSGKKFAEQILTLIGTRPGTFTSLVILGLDFVSWIKFPNFFWGENLHQSGSFDN